MNDLSPDDVAPRIIRKYPNRRLYDTEASAYITLEGIRQLVLDGLPFQVVDKRNGKDISRSILLQIISEEEEGGTPVFGTEILQQVIRLQGDALQRMLGDYLKMSVALFVEQRHRLQKPGGPVALDPLAPLNDFTKKNIEFWSSFFATGTRWSAEEPQAGTPPAEDARRGSGSGAKKNK